MEYTVTRTPFPPSLDARYHFPFIASERDILLVNIHEQMNGMKNVAKRRIRPLGLQAKPVFFLIRKNLSNFTPQNRKEQRSQRWWTGYSNGDTETNSRPLFQSWKGNGISSDLFPNSLKVRSKTISGRIWYKTGIIPFGFKHFTLFFRNPSVCERVYYLCHFNPIINE